MRPVLTIFDEVPAYFQREPTVASEMARFYYNLPSSNRESRLEQKRRELKNRRQKEQENCLHGRRHFPIHWQPGVHPLGERIFYANIEGLRGGPYLLNEMQHQALHDEGHGHEHVSDRFKR